MGLRVKYYWNALITLWILVSSTVVLVTWAFLSDLLQEYQTDRSSFLFCLSPQHLDLLWEITKTNIFQFPICKALCNKSHISLNIPSLQHQPQFQTSIKIIIPREARQFWRQAPTECFFPASLRLFTFWQGFYYTQKLYMLITIMAINKLKEKSL